MSEIEAVGGWIRGAGATVPYTTLEDIDPYALNPTWIAYFDDYRRRYFSDSFVPGQGAEEILFALRDHGGSPARWADLGAGVTSLFWSIAIDSPGQVTVCDLVPEALHVLKRFKESEIMPPCYATAMDMVGRRQGDFDRVRNANWTYHAFDCLKPWPEALKAERHDLVSAIGCLGLAPGPETYAAAFAAAAEHLAPSGRIIGADWVRSNAFIDREGHDNSYLSLALVSACAERAGLKSLVEKEVPIAGDPYYDKVFVWGFGR